MENIVTSFAHGGIVHSTSSNAVAHSLPQIFFIVVSVSLVVLLFLFGTVYLLNRFSLIAVPFNQKDER